MMASFPRPLCQHTKKREIFSSYGSVGGVDILDSDRGPTVVCQKLNVPTSKRQSVCAGTVSLPLYSHPVKVADASHDDCITKVKTNHQKLEKFLQTMKQLKGYVKQNESQKNELQSIYQRLEDDEGYKPLKQLPQNILNLVKEKVEIDEIESFPSVNASYTGGCLSQQNSEDNTDGVLLTTINSTCLYILPYKYTQERQFFKNEELAIKEYTDGKIYQIESAKFGRNIYCGVRLEKKCMFYRIEYDQESVNCICIGEFETESIFTTVAASCYIPGEFAVATQIGDAYLLTSNEENIINSTIVQNLMELRFRCKDNWYWCDFGAHPRQLVIADRTGVAICDVKTPDQERTDIFAIPHSTLHNLERVMVCAVHPQNRFFCWIATNFSLLLIDQRRPNHPILYTDHLLRTCPQYLSVSNGYLNTFKDNIVSVASQEQGEMCCFQVCVTQNKPPHFVGSPWRVSKPRDLVYYVRRMGGVADKAVIKNRLSVSLVGICCVPAVKGFTGIQLTVHGDIFSQTYQEIENTNCEKTFGVCTGKEGWTIKKEDFDHCKEWLNEAMMLDFNNSDSGQIIGFNCKKVPVDLSNILEDQMFPHVMCNICLPIASNDGAVYEDQEVCFVCGHKMAAIQNIKDAVKKNGIMQSDFGGKKLTDIQVEKFEDPKSQILLKLWKEDIVTKKDLEHLLIQLDKEREADAQEKAAETKKTNDKTKIKGASKKRKRRSSEVSTTSVHSDTGSLSKRRRKRRVSGSSTHSTGSNVSTVSSAGFLSTPSRISKKSRLEKTERQRHESESSELSTSILQPFKMIGSQISSPRSHNHDLLQSDFMSPIKSKQSNYRNLSNLSSKGMTLSQHFSPADRSRNSLPSSPQSVIKSSQNTLSSSQKSSSSTKRDFKKKKRHSIMGF